MSFGLIDPVFNWPLFFILSQIWAALFWAVFYLWIQIRLDRDFRSSSIICIQLPSRIHSFSSGNKQHAKSMDDQRVMYTCNSYEENEKQKQLQCTAMFSFLESKIKIFVTAMISFTKSFNPFMRSKSMDWFLYDNGLRHERVNHFPSRDSKSVSSRHQSTFNVDVRCDCEWLIILILSLLFIQNSF